eukprot:TRINITY_DN51343_c0_g1_i1.p2 TRINITY_DN51343_c0_g1~~TRINITY_DN51343_c0_g1_i1.p2  ORF type:complete len:111 (+),score=19.13 TRINITY_DN51343_c0_g1_i1:254-586(+)
MSLRAQHSILIGADILGEHVLEEGGSDDDDDFGAQIVSSRVALGQLQRNTHGSGRGGRGSGGLLGNHRTPISPCLLYTSDAADEEDSVDLGGRRILKKKNTISESLENYL